MAIQTILWLIRSWIGLGKRLPRHAKLPVLLVEDNADDIAQITIHLRSFGCETVAITSPDAALELLKVRQFRMMILDLQFIGFPDAAGIHLANKVHILYPDLPIEIITGHPKLFHLLSKGRSWSFTIKGGDGASLMEGVKQAIAKANGTNGDPTQGQAAFVVWAMCGLAFTLGLLSGIYPEWLVNLMELFK